MPSETYHRRRQRATIADQGGCFVVRPQFHFGRADAQGLRAPRRVQPGCQKVVGAGWQRGVGVCVNLHQRKEKQEKKTSWAQTAHVPSCNPLPRRTTCVARLVFTRSCCAPCTSSAASAAPSEGASGIFRRQLKPCKKRKFEQWAILHRHNLRRHRQRASTSSQGLPAACIARSVRSKASQR